MDRCNPAATKPHEADAKERATKWPKNDDAGTPMGSEKPTGPATPHGGSSGSGVQRNNAASSVVTRSAGEELPEVSDIVMDVEDSCEAQVKRARTIMGLHVCVLEALDDVHDEAAGITTNLTEMCEEYAADEYVAAPEVTEELSRLKTFGGSYREPIVDEAMPCLEGMCAARGPKLSVADSLTT